MTKKTKKVRETYQERSVSHLARRAIAAKQRGDSTVEAALLDLLARAKAGELEVVNPDGTKDTFTGDEAIDLIRIAAKKIKPAVFLPTNYKK